MNNPEWIINIPEDLILELRKSFRMGPIISLDPLTSHLNEVLVGRLDGLKIEIFAREHPPPHFRVYYAGETANYSIEDCKQLNGNLSKWYNNIKKWHSKNKGKLIEEWNARRPSDCPVGEYRD